MRRVRAGAAISLDGFIAGPKGEYDWILPLTAEYGLAEQWTAADTMLVGRKTYEIMARAQPKPKARKQPSRRKRKATTGGMKYYVFSRHKRPPRSGIEWVTDNPAAFVRRLKAAEGKDILVMGGGIFFSWLLRNDLVDDILINVQPIVLGKGIPLFDGKGPRLRLERVRAQPFSNGSVGLDYRVIHGRS